MTTSRFLVVVLVGVSLSAACLALATVLDSPILAIAGTGFVLALFAAREAWLWRGEGRQWLTLMGAVVVVVLVAFAAHRVAG